jgi:hypothetical protein
MSENQYYEFRAVDRPLTDKQMQELRRYSSRAEITSTSFAVEYNWGEFKGKQHRWMEEYFDAFVHVANWDTRWFMLRLPSHLLDAEIVSEYCDDDYLSLHAKNENLVLSFRSDEEDGEWVDGEDWLSSLIALRGDLMKGDHRCLYLAWLRSIQGMEYDGDTDAEAIEPPLPAGLRNLDTPLECFADFLGLDFDLITAAAEESRDERKLQPSSSEIFRTMKRHCASAHLGKYRRKVRTPVVLTNGEPPQRFSLGPTKLRRIGNEWRMSERNRNG